MIPEDIRDAFAHATRTFNLEPYGEILYLKHPRDVYSQSVKRDIYLGSIMVYPDSNGRYNTITVQMSWT